ncbi:MAG: hypothetical protein ABIW31_02060 [Novosphingobium sp.]
MNGGLNRAAIPALAGFGAFLFMTALALSGQTALYEAIIKVMGVRPYPTAFLDTDTVLSAVRCLRAGIDAYAANPCDPELRTYDYSPLWMAMTSLPMTKAWVPWIGTLFVLGFLAALLLLPAGRDGTAVKIIVAGVLSSTTLLALERGNNDLVVFAVVAGAAALLQRSSAVRKAAYALATLAGLLKYYPMLVMATALREKPLRFFAIALTSIAATALFSLITWNDLSRALALIPEGSPFGEMFGVPNLGKGLVAALGLDPTAGKLVRAVMTIGALGLGTWLGLRPATSAALGTLAPRERNFLAVGVLMVIGCYFTAQNINYRGINLLLVLPSLTALRGANAPRWLRSSAWLALGLLWADFLRTWIVLIGQQASGKLYALIYYGPGWLLREAAWWWMACIAVGCAVALLRDGPLPNLVLGKRVPA